MDNTHYIEDFISFIRIITTVLNSNVDKNSSVLYRGHSSVKYQLYPSIFRNNDGLNLKYEDAYYNEILSSYCDEFANIKNFVDKLSKLQHYNCPTRLLDATYNPLVALFFACNTNKESDGEVVVFSVKNERIKNSNSDVATILSSFGFLKYKDKISIMKQLHDKNMDNIKNKRLILDDDVINSFEDKDAFKKWINLMKNDNKYFEPHISLKDLYTPIIVNCSYTSGRIRNQRGCFILSNIEKVDKDKDNKPDLYSRDVSRKIEKMILKDSNNKNIRIIIKSNSKEQILKNLSLVGIDKSFLFPEIEYAIDRFRNKH